MITGAKPYAAIDMVQCPHCKHWMPDGWYIGREDTPPNDKVSHSRE